MNHNIKSSLAVLLVGLHVWFVAIVLGTIAGIILAMIYINDSVVRFVLLGFLFIIVMGVFVLLILIAFRESRVPPELPHLVDLGKSRIPAEFRNAIDQQQAAAKAIEGERENR